MWWKKIVNLTPHYSNDESIILRDFLALERTRLANERTLLSYIRTSLYLVLGGIAFLKLEGFVNLQWLGYVSLGLSFCFIIIGILRFSHLKRSLKKYYDHTDIASLNRDQ